MGKKTSTQLSFLFNATLLLLLNLSFLSAQNVDITLTSWETFWVENTTCATEPQAAYLSYKITNNTAADITDLVVTFSGFTNFSPGAVVFDDPSDPVREFEFLAMNETVSVYFYVDYSAVCDNPIGGGSCAFDGHSASYSVTVTSTAPTATHNGTVISDCMQTTNSAGQATSFILGQNAYVGQFVEQ